MHLFPCGGPLLGGHGVGGLAYARASFVVVSGSPILFAHHVQYCTRCERRGASGVAPTAFEGRWSALLDTVRAAVAPAVPAARAATPAARAAAPHIADGAPAAPAPGAPATPHATDRRSARTRRALRDALADEIRAAGGLDRVAVTAIAERADVTRRTFYSHYKDIPDLVEQSENELLQGLVEHIAAISGVTLDELYAGFGRLEPCPGSVELLAYVKENGSFMSALLGPGGDPRFAEKIKSLAVGAVRERALHGIDAGALGPFFDYYVTFAVSAELGVLQRWLEGGMQESPELMARAMTMLMFIRPGDLYGKPIDLDVPLYGRLFAHLKEIEDR